VAVLAAGALAVDLGTTLIERRDARNAADHAALSAAWANCNGGTPSIAASDSVVLNGYQSGDLALSVPQTDTFRAVVTNTVSLSFTGVLGFDSMQVTGEALTSCSQSNVPRTRSLPEVNARPTGSRPWR
jgi:uncharacterized membrane protein